MIRRIRCAAGSFLRKYPCAVLFLPVALTAGMFLFRPDAPFPLLLLPSFLFLLPAYFLVPFRDFVLKLLAPLFLCAASVFFCRMERRNDPLASFFAGGPGRAEAIVRIEDPSASPSLSPFLPSREENRMVRVLSLTVADGSVLPIDEKVMALFPAQEAARAGYGDVYRVSALFQLPPQGAVPGAFDYRRYLEAHGIRYRMRVDSAVRLEKGHGPMRMLFDGRDRLLARVLPELPEEAASVLPQILFGIRRGTDAGTKADFAASGMIHILSVSGTHVMMFAGFVLFCLAFLPMRVRFFCAVFLTFCYSLSTGMQEPAFRAFLMFSLFFGLRAFLLRSIPLNTLALAACILVIVNPASLVLPGFQFSFLTVAGLLLASSAVRHWFFDPPERILLTPNRWMLPRRIRSRVVFKFAVSALSGCVIAWLISLPLSLLYQGVWPAGSVFANLAALPLVWMTFFFFGISAAAGFFFPPSAVLFCRPLGWCVQGILFLADLFSGWGIGLPPAPVWCAILFLASVFLLISARTVRTAACACMACAVLSCFLYFRKFMLPPEAVFLTDGTDYSFCVLSPALSHVSVIRLPDPIFARTIGDVMASRGIGTCLAFVPARTKKEKEAQEMFFRRFACPVPENSRRRNETGFIRTYLHSPVEFCSWNGRSFFRIVMPDGAKVSGSIREMTSGGLHVELSDMTSGRSLLSCDCFPSNEMKLHRFPLATSSVFSAFR